MFISGVILDAIEPRINGVCHRYSSHIDTDDVIGIYVVNYTELVIATITMTHSGIDIVRADPHIKICVSYNDPKLIDKVVDATNQLIALSNLPLWRICLRKLWQMVARLIHR
jgi:hypothetical protein